MDKIKLNKRYDPGKVESRWYNYWMEKGFFHADEKSDNKKRYCIVIPPPNITGSLHIGHALNNTLQDILIRWKRMDGFNTLWMPGIDHAGIATQNVVEKQLMEEGKDRHELGRERFIERVWKWKEESGGTIIRQLKKLGSTCDWERERFTMDKGLSMATREVFVSLYEDGLIYKGDYIINWCPRCHTALSDLEVEHEETKGNLYYIKYPLMIKGEKRPSTDYLTIATTRPETMLGDTAVAVNPDDTRYTSLIGRSVLLPVANREIPIIADEYVDESFGTGALKITPAHDPNDFDIGVRHNLDQLKVMNDDGTMNEDAGRYKGMDRFECRKELVKRLKEEKYLVKIEDYLHSIGHCYRCRTIVEPTLSKQWFVRVKPLSEPAIDLVRSGRVRIIPKGWENTYFEWMMNIKDWCISRQIWWGHQIPAWNCLDCKEITVSREDPERCVKCGGSNIQQETDVLDTWFSSALWPFSTLGWPEKTQELRLFYPTSVLVTSFDILFFWVARMIMIGLRFMKDVPFRDVYIHALVRDADGQKMSKSRGNIIDPLFMMDKYGTDAFRFTLAAFAAQGRDIKLSKDRIEGYRNFANKLWNASRFTFLNLSDYNGGTGIEVEKSEFKLVDRWILSRLNRTILDVRKALDDYKFNEAASSIYQFIWHEFCDWYIELIKTRLLDEGREKRISQNILVNVLEKSLRLLHPFMPFITEEIWQQLPHEEESIMVSSYPEFEEDFVDDIAEKEMNLIMDVLRGIRNIRGEMDIAPSERLNVILNVDNKNKTSILTREKDYISRLAMLKELRIGIDGKREKFAATAVIDDIEIFIPLEGLINFKEEKIRLEKELQKVKKDLIFVSKKLSNRDFMTRAPAEVVEKDKDKQKTLIVKESKLQENLKSITRMCE